MKKLFIATPCYGGLCTASFAMSMIRSPSILSQNDIQLYLGFMQNESLITRGRNQLVYDFMNTECDYLMFIDADIGFDPSDIVTMIEKDKDIICGLYPKKEINWPQVHSAVMHGVSYDQLPSYTGSLVVNLVGGAARAETPRNEPLEIENGGTGFMLIKRAVFETLADKVPEYNNDMMTSVEAAQGEGQRKIKEFFDTSICEESGGRLLSEDYHFCKVARKNGYQIWAAPWVKLTHTGTYVFSGGLISV